MCSATVIKGVQAGIESLLPIKVAFSSHSVL